MPTLLEYLTRPNLEVNRMNLQPGQNSFSIGDHEVEGVQPWADFTLEKALDCFGDILQADIPIDQLHLPAPISQHHLNLTDESSVDAILKKHNHVIVDRALQLAQSQLEGRGLHLPISWSWGSLSHIEEDTRLRPDWAGTIHFRSPPYENRVPGDTKQSKKWTSAMKDSSSSRNQEEYWKPLHQVLLYCVRVNSRYGYIITDAEALFFRRTKSSEPSQSLAANRPRRQPPQTTHHRVTSIVSVVSETTAMSLDSSGSPYTDAGNPDINEAALEICVVPWTNSGITQMSINLGLWFIHLLATSDISIQEWYPTLGTWQRSKDGSNHDCYRQVGSFRILTSLPPGGILAGFA